MYIYILIHLFIQIERNCQSLVPDFEAFLDCMEPCARIGTNCFQRCAFKTDEISATCQRRCRRVGDVSSDDASGGPGGDAGRSGGDVSASHDVSSAGTLCYRTCYNELLNAAMNR